MDNAPGNRRTRLAPKKGRANARRPPPKIHAWLIRTTRVHAHLCYIVRAFGQGHTTDVGETVEARAARYDRTLLYDCWTHSINELEQLRHELNAEMEPFATAHPPGTTGKVDELERRATRLQNLFRDGDAPLGR